MRVRLLLILSATLAASAPAHMTAAPHAYTMKEKREWSYIRAAIALSAYCANDDIMPLRYVGPVHAWARQHTEGNGRGLARQVNRAVEGGAGFRKILLADGQTRRITTECLRSAPSTRSHAMSALKALGLAK